MYISEWLGPLASCLHGVDVNEEVVHHAMRVMAAGRAALLISELGVFGVQVP